MKITLNNYASALREGLYSLKDALVNNEPNSIISRDFDYVGDLVIIFNDKPNVKAIQKLSRYYDGKDQINDAVFVPTNQHEVKAADSLNQRADQNTRKLPSKTAVAKRMDKAFGKKCDQLNCKPELTTAHYQSMLYNAVHNYLSDDLLNTDSVSLTVTDFEKVQDFADAFQDHDSVKSIKAVRKYYDEPARPAQSAVNQLLADKFQAVIA